MFLFRRWPSSQRYPKTSIKEQFSSISGSQEEESGEPCITSSLPSSSLARQQVVAQEHPSCPFVEPGKGGSTPVPASSRHTPGCHNASSRVPVFLPHEGNQVSVTLHTQTPPPAITGQAVHRPRGGSLCSTMLPLRGYGRWPRWFRWHGPSRSLLALPGPSRWLLRTIRLGYAIQFARRPPKFRGCPLHFSESCRCPCPVCGKSQSCWRRMR